MPEFDRIVPALWESSAEVKAAFSLMNPSLADERRIPGLNLSVSTDEERSVVMSNRSEWFASLGLRDEQVARGRQIHSSIVHIVSEGGIHDDGDGFVTATPEVAVSVLVADCAAILLADKRAGVIAALHAGWRGTVGGIVKNGVDAMISLGASANLIEAYVSPCIEQSHFELGEDVVSLFPDRFVDRESYPKPHADIKGWLTEQLLDAGVLSEHIEVSAGCTFSDDMHFYSYRRQRNKSGRMMAIIWMT